MTVEECRRILGVTPDAGPEAIRQAYLDLARIWHPDRFQSDERLRRVAEQHFQEVSNAYTELKTGKARAGAGAAAANPAPQQPRQPRWAPIVHRRRTQFDWRTWVPLDSRARLALVAALAAGPLFAVCKMALMLTAPAPAITPSANLTAPPAATAEAPRPADVQTAAIVHNSAQRKRADTAPAPPPANGTELIAGQRYGAGELHLANHSDLEAVVKLVSRSGAVARAVYIAPNAAAEVDSIGVGVYNLHVDLGHDLDTERLRFRKNQATPTPMGPFQFAEITSDSGTSGNRYDVVLNPR